MNAAELFQEAAAIEQSFLAHALFQGFKSGVIQQSDEVTPELYDRINLEQAYQEHQKNTLGIKRVQLYTVQLEEKVFAMYFAEHKGQVMELHAKTYRQKAEKVIAMGTRMETSFYDPTTDKHQTWREYRNSLSELPAYVGEFEKM